MFFFSNNYVLLNSLVSMGLKSKEKKIKTLFSPVFFILLIVKSFETFHKHSA